MKRLFTLLLALCMLCGAAAMAESTEITESNASASTTVTYEVKGGYTVVIPAAVTIPTGATETKMQITVKKGALLPSDKWLYVYLEGSTNYTAEDGFRLKAEDGTSFLPYNVYKSSGSAVNMTEGQNWLSRHSAQSLSAFDAEYEITLHLRGTATVPGTYKDTLNFKVALEDDPTK